MDNSSCTSSDVGQAGSPPPTDDRKPTGQAGTGQSADAARDPAGPEDYDSDPQAGGGRLDQVDSKKAPAAGGDAPSHGSR